MEALSQISRDVQRVAMSTSKASKTWGTKVMGAVRKWATERGLGRSK